MIRRNRYPYKSAEDMRQMIPAGVATGAMLSAVRGQIQPGITTLELDRIARDVLRSQGAEPNFTLEPGYFHSICVSVNDEIVHGVPGSRVIEPGDIVSVDAGAIVGGWNGDAAFTTVVPGGPADVHRRREALNAVTEQSLWAGIAALASASYVNEVGAAIEAYIESQGDYGILREYVGHGIGHAMHEEPAVFNYAVRTPGPEVRPGLVIAIEPMVTSGGEDTFVTDDDWTVILSDHSDGAHWEHSVAVTEGGIWVTTAADGGAAELAAYGITPVKP